jgi:hypothetical protein
MKSQIGVFLLFVSASLFAQTYYIKPNWKIGDRFKCDYQIHQIEHEKGELTLDTNLVNEIIFHVDSVDNKYYHVELIMENQVFTVIDKGYNKAGKDFEKARDLILKFDVARDSGKYMITNRVEALNFIKASQKDLENIVENDSVREYLAPMIELTMMPLFMALDNDTTTTSFYSEYMDLFVMPFWKELTLNDTVSEVTKDENPLKKGTYVTTQEEYLLKSYSKSHAELEYIRRIDPQGILAVIKPMMKGMMGAFGAKKKDEQDMEKKVEELLKSMKCDVGYFSKLEIDPAKSMVLKMAVSSYSNIDLGPMGSRSMKSEAKYSYTKL